MTCYTIKDWSEHFEVAQNRSVKKWSWIPVPIKHDGKGYRRVAAMPNAASILGCWMLILEVAAKCPVRGVLADSDGPLTSADLSDKTGIPEPAFSEALEVLSSERIGWLAHSTLQAADRTLQHVATNGTERNGTDLTIPNPTVPNQTIRASTSDVGVVAHDVDWGKAREDANRVIQKTGIRGMSPQDRSLVIKAAAMAQTVCEDFLWDSVEAVRLAFERDKPPSGNRCAYFHGVLESKAKDLGRNFKAMLVQLHPPPELLGKSDVEASSLASGR